MSLTPQPDSGNPASMLKSGMGRDPEYTLNGSRDISPLSGPRPQLELLDRACDLLRRATELHRRSRAICNLRLSPSSAFAMRPALVAAKLPSAADGHAKRPLSNCFANKHRPWPSHHSALSR